MAEQIFLLLLLLFAVLALQQRRLRVAVIYLGVFSLLSSIVYLFHRAPDVAMAEAVIGSTIATILYLVALRKQESLRERTAYVRKIREDTRSHVFWHRIWAALAAAGMVFLLFRFYPWQAEPFPGPTASAYFRHNFLSDTGAENAVTAIYLNYRSYDTIFETLTLLVSVLAVIYLSRYQEKSNLRIDPQPERRRIRLHDEINEGISDPILWLLYPFILLFGFYTIMNGHLTPGGGFQGGAILASVLILRYMSAPQDDWRMHILQITEKLMFLLIILLPFSFVISGWHDAYPWLNVGYLILLNVLIGVKVCCGISLIFIRYAFYESR